MINLFIDNHATARVVKQIYSNRISQIHIGKTAHQNTGNKQC